MNLSYIEELLFCVFILCLVVKVASGSRGGNITLALETGITPGRFVVKIGMKIATHLSTKVSTYAPHARLIFLTGKSMAALSKLILQMVMYFNAGSHVKP